MQEHAELAAARLQLEKSVGTADAAVVGVASKDMQKPSTSST